jgi:hypothetical protein
MDGSIEFKCCSRISISFLETAEMTSSTKRFQNDRDTGTEAKGKEKAGQGCILKHAFVLVLIGR